MLVPCHCRQPIADALAHEAVIGHETPRYQAAAVGIERSQLGRVFIRQSSLLEHVRGAPALPEALERGKLRVGPVGVDRIAQRTIGGEQVDVHKRRRLVENLVGVEGSAHVSFPSPRC
jgi:hypothetical protein